MMICVLAWMMTLFYALVFGGWWWWHEYRYLPAADPIDYGWSGPIFFILDSGIGELRILGNFCIYRRRLFNPAA